jgi:membrane protein implicated in regulation of membrane protease activity
MIEWLNSIGILGDIYFWLAVAATIFLIVQIVMMLFSFGSGGDVDLNGDGVPDGDFDSDVGTGIGIFTVKGMTAFFTLGSWVGLLFCCILPETLAWVSVFPALLCGAIAMFAMGFAMKGMLKLQQSGNLQKENVVGKTATVYIAIQPARSGRGKITLTAQGQFTELDAVTDEAEKLAYGEQVVVTEFQNVTAVVKRK